MLLRESVSFNNTQLNGGLTLLGDVIQQLIFDLARLI